MLLDLLEKLQINLLNFEGKFIQNNGFYLLDFKNILVGF